MANKIGFFTLETTIKVRCMCIGRRLLVGLNNKPLKSWWNASVKDRLLYTVVVDNRICYCIFGMIQIVWKTNGEQTFTQV